MKLQHKSLNRLLEYRFPAVLTNQSPLITVILIGCTTLLVACHTRQATTNHTIKETEQVITITRSNSDFEFYLKGQLEGKFRVFGFNPNPFGANNRDEYLASIGIPLLTTNIFVANAIDSAAEEFAQTNCEKSAAENSNWLAIIAKDNSATSQINNLAGASRGKRTCVSLIGKVLHFKDWRIDGQPKDRTKLQRMTRKSGKVDFSKPILLENIEEIPC